jgi:hypothetical protein
MKGRKKAQEAQKKAVGISRTLAPFAPLRGRILLIKFWLRRRRAVKRVLAVDVVKFAG